MDLSRKYDPRKIQRQLETTAHLRGRTEELCNEFGNFPHLPFRVREAVYSSKIEGIESEYRNVLVLALQRNGSLPVTPFRREELQNPEFADPGRRKRQNFLDLPEAILDPIKMIAYKNEEKRIQQTDRESDLLALHNAEMLESAQKRYSQENRIDEALLLEAHGILLQRETRFEAGIFRTMPVRIGGRIPVHQDRVPKTIQDLFHWFRESGDAPLIGSGILHAAYENIHPFPDGNGRTGRMLLTLLCGSGQNPFPGTRNSDFLGWSSAWCLAKRPNYYQAIRSTNPSEGKEGKTANPAGTDFTEYLEFHLDNVREAALETRYILQAIRKVLGKFQISKISGPRRARMETVLEMLTECPVIHIGNLTGKSPRSFGETRDLSHFTKSTAASTLKALTELGVLEKLPKEDTPGSQGVHVCTSLLGIFES